MTPSVNQEGNTSYQLKPRFGEPIADWGKWFAWRPVNTLDRGVVWLRPVYRRRCELYDYIIADPNRQWWQYAKNPTPKEDVKE